jgi:hypothetical protein
MGILACTPWVNMCARRGVGKNALTIDKVLLGTELRVGRATFRVSMVGIQIGLPRPRSGANPLCTHSHHRAQHDVRVKTRFGGVSTDLKSTGLGGVPSGVKVWRA